MVFPSSAEKNLKKNCLFNLCLILHATCFLLLHMSVYDEVPWIFSPER